MSCQDFKTRFTMGMEEFRMNIIIDKRSNTCSIYNEAKTFSDIRLLCNKDRNIWKLGVLNEHDLITPSFDELFVSNVTDILLPYYTLFAASKRINKREVNNLNFLPKGIFSDEINENDYISLCDFYLKDNKNCIKHVYIESDKGDDKITKTSIFWTQGTALGSRGTAIKIQRFIKDGKSKILIHIFLHRNESITIGYEKIFSGLYSVYQDPYLDMERTRCLYQEDHRSGIIIRYTYDNDGILQDTGSVMLCGFTSIFKVYNISYNKTACKTEGYFQTFDIPYLFIPTFEKSSDDIILYREFDDFANLVNVKCQQEYGSKDKILQEKFIYPTL